MREIESDYKNNIIHLTTLSHDESEKDDIISINVDDIVKIDENDLSSDLQSLSRNFSYFSRHLVIKDIKKERFKQLLNQKTSLLYVQTKKSLTRGGKEPSDTKIRNEVDSNETLGSLKMKLIDIEGEVKQLQSICRSIDLKQRAIKDLLYLKIKHEELIFDNMRQGVKNMVDVNKFEKTKEN